jgi:general secretion pathway protein C
MKAPLLEVVSRRWAAALLRRGPALACALLVIAIAWILARLTWQLLPAPKSQQAAYSAPDVALHQFDVNRLVNQHLFGTAAPAAANGNAPDTTLALTLHGIVAGHSTADSRAIIVANGDEEPYAIGASLPGGAVVRAIFPDRVLLARDGRIEALRLPRSDTSGGDSGTNNTSFNSPPVTGPTALPGPADLGALRQEIQNNPQNLANMINTVPYKDSNNQLIGYRVYPRANPALFTQLGLRPGDVVTAVNGNSLGDPGQMMKIMSGLKTSDQVSVTVLRDGQQQTLMLQLPDSNQ